MKPQTIIILFREDLRPEYKNTSFDEVTFNHFRTLTRDDIRKAFYIVYREHQKVKFLKQHRVIDLKDILESAFNAGVNYKEKYFKDVRYIGSIGTHREPDFDKWYNTFKNESESI